VPQVIQHEIESRQKDHRHQEELWQQRMAAQMEIERLHKAAAAKVEEQKLSL
jgi:hypothetical protein